MSTITKRYDFSAGTNAASSEVNVNFDDIIAFLNNNVLHVDGSKAMTGLLTLKAASPTSDNHAARKKYVDDELETHESAAVPHGRFAKWNGSASSPIVGSGGPSTSQTLRMTGGYNAGNTDGSGDIQINFTPAFSNGVIAVSATLVGDFANQLNSHCQVRGVSKTGMKVRVYDGDGASHTSDPVKVTWTAIGW